jgi:hypothetical protein
LNSTSNNTTSTNNNNNNQSGKQNGTNNTAITANTTTTSGKTPCGYCKGTNHNEDNSIKKLKDTIAKLQSGNNTANVALLCYDTCLLTSDSESNITPNPFIADSGASVHMVHSKHLLSNFKEDKGEFKVGDNTMVESLGTGTPIQKKSVK